jgi:hypothetical protein
VHLERDRDALFDDAHKRVLALDAKVTLETWRKEKLGAHS